MTEPAGQSGNGLDIGYKGFGLRAVGPLAILAVSFILMVGLLGWINYRGFEDVKMLLVKSVRDHSELVTSQDRLSCVVSLSPEERTRLRQGGRETFLLFCPWMRP